MDVRKVVEYAELIISCGDDDVQDHGDTAFRLAEAVLAVVPELELEHTKQERNAAEALVCEYYAEHSERALKQNKNCCGCLLCARAETMCVARAQR